jgi:uncharacterized membrane protein YkoI
MTRRKKLVLVGTAVVALGAGGVAFAQTGGDSDEQATGPQAERAKQAALEAAGGGRVVGIERENEGDSAWEVEIALDNGRSVEVALNENLQKVGGESDDDRGGENEGERGDED